MEFFNDHRKLFGLALGLFVGLTLFVVILPAFDNQRNNAPLAGDLKPMGDTLRGMHLYIANGCVGCHTQQVRNVDMDRVWGARPGIAADYAKHERMTWWMNTATLMGTERTGPDLTNVGNRLPSADWHLLHLYNPRSVVPESIMPAYPWLFEWKDEPAAGDKVVNVPDDFRGNNQGTLVAREEALQLVTYLQSLKQIPLPDGTTPPEFLYGDTGGTADAPGQSTGVAEDGARLYASNCQACHQADGRGLPGAFPPLAGSKIVLDDDPAILVEVIMRGYDARPDYGPMPPIGTMNGLGAAEITAIINHERTSWGNAAREVSVEEVEDILLMLEQEEPNI